MFFFVNESVSVLIGQISSQNGFVIRRLFQPICGGLIHDADYERGSYFLERRSLGRFLCGTVTSRFFRRQRCLAVRLQALRTARL